MPPLHEHPVPPSLSVGKLQHHFSIWLIAATLGVAMWVHVAGLIAADRARTLATTESTLVNLVRVTQEHTERTLASVDQTLRLAQWELRHNPAALNLQALSGAGLLDREVILQVAFIDAQGLLRQSTLPFKGPIDLSDREHFKVHVNGDPAALFISRPVLGRASGKWSIQMSRRITDSAGRFGGVVVASVDPAYFTQFFGALQMGAHGIFNLLARDGTVLARRIGTHDLFEGNVSASPVFTLLGQGSHAGTFTGPGVLDGVQRLVHFRALPNYPLLIAIGVDSSDVLASHVQIQRDLKIQAGIATVFLLLVAALASWYVRARRHNSLEQAQALGLLQDLTSRVPGVVYQYLRRPDGSACFPFASEGIHGIYRLSPQDLSTSAARVMERIHPDDRAQVAAGIEQSFRTLELWAQDYRVRFEDGTVRWLSGKAAPQQLADGSVLWHGFISDVTEHRQAQESLLTLSAAVEHLPVSIVITDSQGTIQYVNPKFEQASGYSRAEALGQHARFLAADEASAEQDAAMWAAIGAGAIWTGEFHNQRKDGTVFWEQSTVAPIFDAAGTVIRYLAIKEDVTERKYAETQLRIAATAFESHEGMFVADHTGVILRVNQAFTDITGYTSDEAVGKTPSLLSSGHHDAAFYAAMRASVEERGSWQGEIWNRRKNGEVFPEWLTITAVKDMQGVVTHYVSTLTDITTRKAAEDQIRNLAFYDPLTGLPNRRLLVDRLRYAVASRSRHHRNGALLFIDLDNFKSINDTMGHDQGDVLLCQVTQRLKECVREGDTVARFGGDEFVVMLQELGDNPTEAAAHAEMVGEKILDSLRQPHQLDRGIHHSSASVGIALFSADEVSVEELLKRADLALYQAKDAGRNALRFFDPDMQAAMTARAELEADLRLGLQQGQLVLYYQPQVDDQGQLTGVEALVRWQHPVRGMVSPADFIPLAEDTRLVLPLGQWVLETACRQLKAWSGQPRTAHLTLAVNVSALQFRGEHFVADVLATLERTGAPAHRLKVELTESLLVVNVEDTIAKMLQLKARGVGFSLDDFGTGYSSLSYLKRLPLDQLKIDQSFLHEALSNSKDAAIVRATVAMGKSLGLVVIAEGVETRQQRDFLLAEGCHHFQGYYFGRPGPVEALDVFLAPPTPSTP